MVTRRLIRWLAVVPAAAVTTLGLTAAKRPDASVVPQCEVAKAWVKDHMNNLPKTEAEFAKLTVPLRKAVYRVLTVRERAAIWHEHLAVYLRDDSGLSAAQRDFIRQADARFDAYLDPTTGKDAMKTDDVEARAKALFGKVRAGEIFASLGTSPRDESQSSLQGGGPSAENLQFCECSHASDFCFFFCGDPHPPCDVVPVGCGFALEFQCDGVCA